MTTKSKSTSFYMRIFHRYLGFFLIGIMAVYALSGVVLIFRDTEFLKKEVQIERKLRADIPSDELGKELRMKDFKLTNEDGDIIYFENGSYNKVTGIANYTGKELPYVLNQMTKLHKANTNHPLFYLNIFFGASLLFFVVSSFWMFLPKTKTFKKGMYYTIAGVILTIVLLFV